MPSFYAGLSESVPDLPSGRFLISAHRGRKSRWRQPYIPRNSELAVDCGAFAAWRHGLSPIDIKTYVAWIAGLTPRPTWAASIDVMFDPDQTYWNWMRVPVRVPWTWIPTAHGATPAEYAENAARLVWEADTGSPHFRLGVGGLVPKTLDETCAVVASVAYAVPDVKLHLWGVGVAKIPALAHCSVLSCDTSTWSITIGRHRPSNMTRKDFLISRLAKYRERIEAI